MTTHHPLKLAQYKRLIDSVSFYVAKGYEEVDAPWLVDPEACNITRPPDVPPIVFQNLSGRDYHFVASAEQSFLDLALKGKLDRKKGQFVALTPCIRNESVTDHLRGHYFMKTELIAIRETEKEAFHEAIMQLSDALEFFGRYVESLWMHTEEGFDIIDSRTRIELGSYGVRYHQDIGWWAYGTGCAEPRLSAAMEENSGN